MTQALLMTHGGAKIGRQDLRDLNTPEATSTFQPVPHAKFVEAILESLAYRKIEVGSHCSGRKNSKSSRGRAVSIRSEKKRSSMGRGHLRERVRQAGWRLENPFRALLPESDRRLRNRLGERRKTSCETQYRASAGSATNGRIRNIPEDVLPSVPLHQPGDPFARSISSRHRGNG